MSCPQAETHDAHKAGPRLFVELKAAVPGVAYGDAACPRPRHPLAASSAANCAQTSIAPDMQNVEALKRLAAAAGSAAASCAAMSLSGLARSSSIKVSTWCRM